MLIPEWYGSAAQGSLEDYHRGRQIALDREFERAKARRAAAYAQRNVYTPDTLGWKAGYEAAKAGMPISSGPSSKHNPLYLPWHDGYLWREKEMRDAQSMRQSRPPHLYDPLPGCRCGCNG